MYATDAPTAPAEPFAPTPAIAIAPAREFRVERSLAVTLIFPAAPSSSPARRSPMFAIFAVTELRTQLSDAEPAPEKVGPPLPAAAIAAICTSSPAGRSDGRANVASTRISPVTAVIVDPSIRAVTVSWIVLTATAMPTADLPLKDALTLPARVAIDAVSLASTETVPLALTSEAVDPTALMCASTVFLIMLIANEPPKALPPLVATAPPITTLMICAFSSALTVTFPALETTRAASSRATTELRMSLTPIDALIAAPLPSEKASAPVPA